ncbi:hypothetical protein OB955_23870 [Halobacteria archaeon AArc-m2/3/4]|uniref:Uncharacterized protein n=1 Tax=Natronoglomus mannanivorans TaxID=2979990 RepID=A0AAP2Z4B5_9EURY|nr:hypothetical protein [Halobacteria archaeon AArc-xg1-1]MCU4975724.1 hypothetical protein [Halobacteria archaeon AArc-m2/3/4]
MPTTGLIVAGVFAAFGLHVARSSRSTRERARTAEQLHEHADKLEDGGEGTTAHGPVTVSEPGLPDRMPPADADANGGDPALWAWRVREKRSKNQGGSTWRTTESGLAVGSFSLRQDWQDVTVDGDSLADDAVGVLQGQADPFEAPNCYLGDPEIDEYLGELDPVNKRLEQWGLTGEDGLVSGVEFTISSGRKTMTPDRYQATVVREGDELLVRGELDESGEGSILRGTEEVPMVVAVGDLERRADRIRTKAKRELATGIGIVIVALVIAAVAVL